MRTKGVTLVDLFDFGFLHGLLELLFCLFLMMKGDSKSSPPSSSPFVSPYTFVHCVSDSPRLIVAYNVVESFYFAKAFCAYFFFTFAVAIVAMVYTASPIAALLVQMPTSEGVS